MLLLLALRAALIAVQTLCGLAGIGTSCTPSPESASTTPLMIVDAAPMVPASPMPLTPSWLVGDGVTVWPVVIDGTSLAAGTRYSASVDDLRLPSVS